MNQGFDPYEMIKMHRLPPALSNSILAAIYDDGVRPSLPTSDFRFLTSDFLLPTSSF